MKRCLSLALCLVLALGIIGCGGGGTSSAGTWREKYDLGVRYLSEGNYQEAILAFEAAIQIDPKQADAYLSLAQAYEAMGNAEQAAQVIEDAIAELGELEELLAARRPRRQVDEPGYMTLLMTQSYSFPQDAWQVTRRGTVVYRYDEYGYILEMEQKEYHRHGQTETEDFTWTDRTEFTYQNGEVFAHRWWSHPDGRQQDYGTESRGQAAPGSWTGILTGFTGEQGLCMDPHPGENGEYWFCPARVENTWLNSETDWAYAEVTYDDRGYPVAFTSYTKDGTVCGTAELYWQTVRTPEENNR